MKKDGKKPVKKKGARKTLKIERNPISDLSDDELDKAAGGVGTGSASSGSVSTSMSRPMQ